MLRTIYYKLKAMAGGGGALLCLPVAAALCFLTLRFVLLNESADMLRVAVVDSDRSTLSAEYLADLQHTEGLNLLLCDTETDARRALTQDKAEAVLCIDPGFGEAVRSGSVLPLRYTGGALGASGRAAREILGGRALALQSGYRALLRLEADGMLAEETERRYLELLRDNAGGPPLVEFTTGAEEAGAASFTASHDSTAPRQVFAGGGSRYVGFTALLMALAELSLAVLLNAPEATAVNRRCAAFRERRAFGPLTDVLSLTAAGLAVALVSLLCRAGLGMPSSSELLRTVLMAPGLALVSAGLARSRADGGSDTAAPLLALLLAALAGGFF